MQIRCSVCKENFRSDDTVFLDDLISLTHITCYERDPVTIKDIGSYETILERYKFFKVKGI